MDWLAKEKIFIKLDSLGVNKIMTIGYLSKWLHPHYTNRENLKNLHNNVLEDIDLDANLAVKLGPSLKAHQMEAITDGNIYTPDIPHFEVYGSWMGQGQSHYRHNRH